MVEIFSARGVQSEYVRKKATPRQWLQARYDQYVVYDPAINTDNYLYLWFVLAQSFADLRKKHLMYSRSGELIAVFLRLMQHESMRQ